MPLHHKQLQFELFPETTDRYQGREAGGLAISSLTLSLEHIIIVAILSVMALILSFAIGVERGKRIAYANRLDTRQQPALTAEATLSQPDPEPVVVPAARQPVLAAQPEDEESMVEQVAASVQQAEPTERTTQQLKDVYTVQVASFKSEKYAQKEASALGRNIGQEIFVMSKGNYSIVCVGKFEQKDKAKVLVSKLKQRYKDCLIRRL